jgi:hypothetical protein
MGFKDTFNLGSWKYVLKLKGEMMYKKIGMLELADSFHLGWNGAIRASSNLVTYI